MADFSANIIIERPVEEVFQYASSMENAPQIMPAVMDMEKLTDGETGVGSKFKETRWIRGKNVHADVEIIKFEPNRSFTTRSNSNGLVTIYEYEFEEIVEGTQVQLRAFVQTKGIKMWLTRGYIVKMIKEEDGGQLRCLKEALEDGE
ncbi:SRPBCC family protein [Neobacillus sp. PS3-34]|uniref:SRPBCC family protein n=1 Tax=Neobacillus sp. PS3-34 TaxID=3070678 RepID=UPI0027DFF2E3|nr:SRPBCC family protein [Neobacillus sp. PS3-34]WML50445.1 SRPBCC family protein [Neobacillus sp. PS3-34]